MSALLNTHSYDGKLLFWKSKLIEDQKKYTWLGPEIFSFDVSIQESKLWLLSLKKEKKVNCESALQSLLLLAVGGPGNHDLSNDLNVEDIYPIIWASIRSLNKRLSAEEAIPTHALFIEQLGDIQNGSCPQGRIFRLLMCYGLIESALVP